MGNDSDLHNLDENEKKIFEAILSEEGQFRYRNVPNTTVNKHGIVPMRFQECDNVTFGILVNVTLAPEISTKENKYDWSKVSILLLFFG